MRLSILAVFTWAALAQDVPGIPDTTATQIAAPSFETSITEAEEDSLVQETRPSFHKEITEAETSTTTTEAEVEPASEEESSYAKNETDVVAEGDSIISNATSANAVLPTVATPVILPGTHADTPVEASADTPTDAPETLADAPETPVETPVETPIKTPIQTPIATPVATPVETSDEPDDTHTSTPAAVSASALPAALNTPLDEATEAAELQTLPVVLTLDEAEEATELERLMTEAPKGVTEEEADLQTQAVINTDNVPAAAIEAAKDTKTIERPEEYEKEDDDHIKDPFEQQSVFTGFRKDHFDERKIETYTTNVNYFSDDHSIITNNFRQNTPDVVEENAAFETNDRIVREAFRARQPLGILYRIPLPSIFVLTGPPNPGFITQLIPRQWTFLPPGEAINRWFRMIRILRAMADDNMMRSQMTAGPLSLSYYRAAQVLDMTIVVLKRLWFLREGVITSSDFIWTPEYQALLYLRPDWQIWLRQQLAFASSPPF